MDAIYVIMFQCYYILPLLVLVLLQYILSSCANIDTAHMFCTNDDTRQNIYCINIAMVHYVFVLENVLLIIC